MAHIKIKVTAAPASGWRNTRSDRLLLWARYRSGNASSTSRQSSGTSSQRTHSSAASTKLFSTASTKPAPANPAARTRVPGGCYVDKQPRHGSKKCRQMVKPALPCAQYNGQQQDQHIQKPGHLVPTADDKANHDPGGAVQSAPLTGQLRRKAQPERQPGIEHGQREIRQVVHWRR